MDELENRLRAEHEAVRASLPHHGPEALAHVRRGAKRRRRMRALATGATAVIAVGVIGVGAWGVAGTDRAADVQPMVSDSPSATSSPDPSAEPSPESTSTSAPTPTATASVALAGPALDDSPDRIPENGYPPLTAERATPAAAAAGITYPRAHVLEDWVWDRVGPGWSLEIASVQLDPFGDDWEQPPAVMYLTSPEDRHFEVAELPERAWDDARVVSWREGADTAMIWWAREDAEEGRVGSAGAVNLRTGGLDDLRMAVYGDTAHDYRFVMANAAGDELWRAESDAGFKFYRWSEGADEDGWVASALVDKAPTADMITSVHHTRFAVTNDGDRVLLTTFDDGVDSPPSAQVPLVTYDLRRDAIQRHQISLPVEVGYMHSPVFDGKESVVLWFNPDGGSPASVESHELFEGAVAIELGGTGTVARMDAAAGRFPEIGRPVPFGASSPPGVGAEECGC